MVLILIVERTVTPWLSRVKPGDRRSVHPQTDSPCYMVIYMNRDKYLPAEAELSRGRQPRSESVPELRTLGVLWTTMAIQTPDHPR